MKSSINADAEKLSQEGLSLDESIIGFFKFIDLAHILKTSAIKCACGYAAHIIFMVLFILPFVNKNIYREVVKNNDRVVSKDAVYDFMKSTSANWMFFLLQAAVVLVTFFCSLLSKKRFRVIIFDDTPFKKNRSKFVELLARCFDHILQTHFKGFRLLNMAWTDGFSTVPLGFILLSSGNKENRYQETKKDFDPRSNSAKRRSDAISTAVSGTLKLFDMVATVLLGRYDAVVFDSWFAMNSVIENISKKAPVVCMVKRNNQLWFKFCGMGTIEKVYRELKNKKRGCANIIGSCIVDLMLGKCKNATSIKCKIVFVRNRKTHDWIPLLCTNTSFSDQKIIQLYAMRWNIEVFHHDVKQFLRLEKGCQSTSYDALTAYVTVVYIQYMFLAYRQRLKEDKRKMGIGSLFYACCEEIKQISREEAVLRVCADAIREGHAATGRMVNGVKLYTQEEFDAAVFSALANFQQSAGGSVEITILTLIERQKSIEKLGQSLVARLRAMQNSEVQLAS